MVQGEVWMLADGSVTGPEGTLASEIQKWRKWTYYKLVQKELKYTRER